VVRAIAANGDLRSELAEQTATDLLWTLLSVENWERLVRDCGWSQAAYEQTMRETTEATLLASH